MRTGLCLLSAVMIAFGSGCDHDPRRELLTATFAELHSCYSAKPPDYVAAHDFLLAAMRIDPGSPEVFKAALDYVERTASANGGEPPGLAEDIYDRANALIPYLSIGEIAAARTNHRDLEHLLVVSEQIEQDPLTMLQAGIEAFPVGKLPPEVESSLLQQFRDQQIELFTSQDWIASKPVSDVERLWRETTEKLDAKEREHSARLFGELIPLVDDFMAHSAKLLEECKKSGDGTLEVLGTKLRGVADKGASLCAELAMFAATNIEGAELRLDEVQRRTQELRRNGAWMRNLYTLHIIRFVSDPSTDVPTPERLRRLARCDEELLSPYVYARFQEAWDRWFAELETDEERVEASKVRVLDGIVSHENI